MLLARKTTVRISDSYSLIISRMGLASYKLWNTLNYERRHYKELNLPVEYPNWYYQKKVHKDNPWARQMPSHSFQELCKLMDKSWKAFYESKKAEGGEKQQSPGYKYEPMAVSYLPSGISHVPGSDVIRLSLSKQLKEYMAQNHDIHEDFLYLQNSIFTEIGDIRQIKVLPPGENTCEVVINYRIPDPDPLPANNRFLSIDLGLHNLMTCYNSVNGETFIAGRKYLSICHYYDKEIARVQSEWSKQQRDKGVKCPKSSKHIRSLHKKKKNSANDYLHKLTNTIAEYCRENDIRTVVIGDIKSIRKGKDFGSAVNQEFHALPFDRIYRQLEYKLKLKGIRFEKIDEAFSSSTSPLEEIVSRESADKSKRIKRGLYVDGEHSWNADCVGAFNILRLYLQKKNINLKLDPEAIRNPYILKVAV